MEKQRLYELLRRFVEEYNDFLIRALHDVKDYDVCSSKVSEILARIDTIFRHFAFANNIEIRGNGGTSYFGYEIANYRIDKLNVVLAIKGFKRECGVKVKDILANNDVKLIVEVEESPTELIVIESYNNERLRAVYDFNNMKIKVYREIDNIIIEPLYERKIEITRCPPTEII